MITVVDSSVIIKWLVVEEGHTEALQLLNKQLRLACPDFAFAEVANVLRRKVRAAEIAQKQAAESLDRLPEYFDMIVPSSELLSASFSLAEKLDHSVYDCMFLALAQQELDAVVVTADGVFVKKCIASGFTNSIQHLKNFTSSIQTNPEPQNG